VAAACVRALAAIGNTWQWINYFNHYKQAALLFKHVPTAIPLLSILLKLRDAMVLLPIGTRTNTNPNDTEANAAGRCIRACNSNSN
jgi:hypothetical protein